MPEHANLASDPSISQWIAGAKQGDAAAQRALWQRYFAQLVRLARGHLDVRARRVSDEEDIVASVFESFFRAAKNGRFPDLNDRDDLWRLLLRMTVRKAIDQRRKHGRQKHGGGKLRGESVFGRGQDAELAGIDLVIGDEPSPLLAVQVVEQVEHLLSKLSSERDRHIAIGKLEGYTNRELAEKHDCSVRTIEHRLKLIRVKWSRDASANDE